MASNPRQWCESEGDQVKRVLAVYEPEGDQVKRVLAVYEPEGDHVKRVLAVYEPEGDQVKRVLAVYEPEGEFKVRDMFQLKNDFEALKFSGVAAVLLAAFLSYHRFCNKERMTAADRPTKFILVLGNIFNIKL